MSGILLYGIQRSGTNFLENIVLTNYDVSILNRFMERDHPAQKHFRLYKEKDIIPEPQYTNTLIVNSYAEYVTSLEIEEKIDGCLLISKDPYSWLLSYKRWAEKVGWQKVDHHYIQEYNYYYRDWLKFRQENEHIHFIRYRDLLLNTNEEMENIQDKLGIKLKRMKNITGTKTKFKKVSSSTKFDESRLNYYKNREYLQEYSIEELTELNSNLDEEVVAGLGYELITDTKEVLVN